MRGHQYPETHVVEIDQPHGMPLQLKGLFHRGKLKWFSCCVIGPDGKRYPCEMPEDESDPMLEKMQECLHMVFTKSEKLNRKPNPNKRC